VGAYFYSNAAPSALARLLGLEALEDGATIEILKGVGIQSDWKCLELGAGAGSIAYWLAETTGVPGNVCATDIDVGLLDSRRCDVHRHDLRVDSLPSSAYDLVHFRHLLIHLPMTEHPDILRRLLSVTRPGGLIVAEESDLHTWRAATSSTVTKARIFNDGIAALHEIYTKRGLDTAVGTKLSRMLHQSGWSDISQSARTWRVKGGTPEAEFHVRSMRQLAESCESTFADLADCVRSAALCCEDPDFEYHSRTTLAAVARRAS